MAEEIDPQLPFVQVSRGSAAQAAQLAPALGITYQHARGALLLLWEGLAQRRLLAEALASGGAVMLSDADCRLRLRLAFGVEVDPALAAAAGFLEAMPGPKWRVRGMSRYLTAERTRLGRKGGATPTPPRRHPGATPTAPGVPPPREGGPTPHTLDVRRETVDGILKQEALSLTPSASPTLEDKLTDAEFEIFNCWRVVHHGGSAKVKPTPERKRLIAKWLKVYPNTDLIAAIEGCAKSPHNMGINDRHQKYNSLELILRDAEHIERFRELRGPR